MSDQQVSTVDRRRFLAAAAAGAAVVTSSQALASVPVKGTKGLNLGVGTDLGEGWAVESLLGVEAGAFLMVVVHPATGRRAQVGVCRHEPGRQAMATTGRVDLFLMNDGKDGAVRTPDDEVRVVQRLAARLEGVERKLPGMGQLLGQRERLTRFDPIDHLEPMESSAR